MFTDAPATPALSFPIVQQLAFTPTPQKNFLGRKRSRTTKATQQDPGPAVATEYADKIAALQAQIKLRMDTATAAYDGSTPASYNKLSAAMAKIDDMKEILTSLKNTYEHTTPPKDTAKRPKVENTTIIKFKWNNLKQIPPLETDKKTTVTTWLAKHIQTFYRAGANDGEILDLIPQKFDDNLRAIWDECREALEQHHIVEQNKSSEPNNSPHVERLEDIITLFRAKLLKGMTISDFKPRLEAPFNPDANDFNRHQRQFQIVVQDIMVISSAYTEVFFAKEFLRTLPSPWISKFSTTIPSGGFQTVNAAIAWGTQCCEQHNKIKDLQRHVIPEDTNALAPGTAYMHPTTQRHTTEITKEWTVPKDGNIKSSFDMNQQVRQLLKSIKLLKQDEKFNNDTDSEAEVEEEEEHQPLKRGRKPKPATRSKKALNVMTEEFDYKELAAQFINSLGSSSSGFNKQNRGCSFCRKIHEIDPKTGLRLPFSKRPPKPAEATYMNHRVSECDKLKKNKHYTTNNNKWCGFCGNFGHECTECKRVAEFNAARNHGLIHADRRANIKGNSTTHDAGNRLNGRRVSFQRNQ